MTEATTDSAQSAGDDIAIVPAPASAPDNMSIRQAASSLRSWRATATKKDQATDAATTETSSADTTAAADQSPDQVRGSQESASQEADATSQDTEIRGETQSADQEVEKFPPIEAPRSWTKEDKELFTSLPRETQERLVDRERSRETDFLRRQNEAAEKLKGLTAKEQAVEQARQQYESALPQLLGNLQGQQAGEFADVKTMADVERLAREDWPRYLQWDVAQKKIAAVTQEMLSAQQRQAQEKLQRFSEFAKHEDNLFIERVPDMADAEKAAKLQGAAMTVLKDLGFSETELGESWNGGKDLSLRDHRVQLLIRDATLWREAQSKAKAASIKPVPPVQRPGVAQGKSASSDAEIQNLTKQLERASGMNAMRIAAKLTAVRRAAAGR
jgi:hypothetical protein